MPKFIARRDFANNLNPPLKIDGKVTHERHIHKGAEFAIGDPAIPFEDLADRAPERSLISQLAAAECIVESSDAKGVAKVKREMEADAKREKTNKELIEGAQKLAGNK